MILWLEEKEYKRINAFWTQNKHSPASSAWSTKRLVRGMLMSVEVKSSHWQVAKRLRSWASSKSGLRMSALQPACKSEYVWGNISWRNLQQEKYGSSQRDSLDGRCYPVLFKTGWFIFTNRTAQQSVRDRRCLSRRDWLYLEFLRLSEELQHSEEFLMRLRIRWLHHYQIGVRQKMDEEFRFWNGLLCRWHFLQYLCFGHQWIKIVELMQYFY